MSVFTKSDRAGTQATKTPGTEKGPSGDLRELRSARAQTQSPTQSAGRLQRENFQTQIHPARMRDASQQLNRQQRVNSRGETLEARAARKEREQHARERQVRLRQEQKERTETAQQAQREITDNLVDERALSTNRSTQLSDRTSAGADAAQSGRVDLATELAREATKESGLTAKLGVTEQSASLETRQEGLAPAPREAVTAIPSLRETVHVFADRGFSNTEWYLRVMNFFANTDPIDLDEREREELLSEIENLTAAELTPQKMIRLIMLGSICQEALIKVEERVRELGDKAPASAAEIGKLMRKGLELWRRADEVAFDPRNN